ncbi:unnamed protein product [Cuscuta campestris]|uniref:CCHC-type domain-containing protein n=1 Tax=Cuscuta campestris TaxID=132261 RepID=A0A484KQ12_9ASTE|nr:unnamed protein product [Cuscuta campestris]
MANAPMFQQPQPPQRHITFKTLKNNGAEEFLGNIVDELQVALDWIEQVARVLNDLNVPVADHPKLASQLLRKGAYEWWKCTDSESQTPKPWTLAYFDWAFKKEYIPARFREEKRIKEFRKRLRPDVRPYVSTVVTIDFSVAYDLMAKAEKAVDDLKASMGAEGIVSSQQPTTRTEPSEKRSFGGTKGTQNFKKTKSAPAQSQAASNRSKPSRHPVCNLCGRNHPGECWFTLGLCLGCGKEGRFRKDCPTNPGRAFPIAERGYLEYTMIVSNSLGHSIRLHHLYRNCPLAAHGHRLSVNLIELPYKEFDIILSMDWLTERQAIIDCGLRTVRLKTDDENGINQGPLSSIGSSTLSIARVPANKSHRPTAAIPEFQTAVPLRVCTTVAATRR